jgi:hypothetical protein
LTVGAVASPTARYQWTFNGVNVSNGTNASLTLSGVTEANLGPYKVWVTNAIGAVWSTRADLLPEKPLHFSARHFVENGFHLQVYGPAGTNYAIDCSIDFTNWMPLTTNRTQTGIFSFVDVSARTNACGYYRVRVVP